MKNLVSPALASFLDGLCQAGVGGSYLIIDLFTVILQNGITLRWAAWSLPISFPSTGIYSSTSYLSGTTYSQGQTVNYSGIMYLSLVNSNIGNQPDISPTQWQALGISGNIRVGGQAYSAAGPYVNRTQITQYLKLKTSQCKITIMASPAMTIPGTSTLVLAAISQGMFAGAMVYVDRLWAQSARPLDLTLGTMVWFVGRVANIEVNRARAILTCNDPTILFDDQHPRNLYLTGCRHSFGDAGCTYNTASTSPSAGGGAPATALGTIQAGSTTVTLNTNLTQPGPLAPPSSLPSYTLLTGQTNVNLPAATYYVVETFIGASGESLPGPELAVAVTGGGENGTTATLLQVNAPSSPPAGATGWNVYVGLASGEEELQQTFVGFSSSWIQIGTLAQGSAPPVQGTQGYFATGLITFTSGVLNGLTQAVVSYSNPSGSAGIVIVTPPLLTAPSSGDSFSITSQCDKSIAICSQRWKNIAFYAGAPWMPAVELAI